MYYARVKKYKHVVAVLDSGDLEPRCLEGHEIHWRGQPQPQSEGGVARAHVAASSELKEHVKETGHVETKRPR